MHLNLINAEEALRKININIHNEDTITYKTDKEIIENIADKFYQIDKDVRDIVNVNIKEGIRESQKNDNIKALICQSLVGIRESNKLYNIINEIVIDKFNKEE